jgi:sugar phosphate isomerase/epimerase
LELAAEMGCPQVKTFGGALPKEVPAQTVFDYVADHVQRIARRGQELGVRLLLETHDGFSPSAHVKAILDRVPSAGFAALWDVHHPYRMGESPQHVDAALGPRVGHVHVKDCNRAAAGEDKWHFVLLGEGELAAQVQQAIALLARRGFDGYISVDWEKQWHPEIADPEVALPHFARVLRQYVAAADSAGAAAAAPAT